MTKQEIDNKLKELAKEYELSRKKLLREYCDANNPYKVGDKFTDCIGSIIIEEIKYNISHLSNPCCVYFGTELKKDGTPKKKNIKRLAFQSNDISFAMIGDSLTEQI